MERIYREDDSGALIKGIGLPAFIHNIQYHLVLIHVYEDGIIDCWEKVDFEGFVDKVRAGRIVTRLPQCVNISRFHSFTGTSDSIETYVEEEEFIKEVRDTLDNLQGKPNSGQRCKDSLKAFLEVPSEENSQRLIENYQLIPNHLKEYILGDLDSDSGPIRQLLTGRALAASEIADWLVQLNKWDR